MSAAYFLTKLTSQPPHIYIILTILQGKGKVSYIPVYDLRSYKTTTQEMHKVILLMALSPKSLINMSL